MMARKANASANKTTSRVMALGLLLATLLVMLLPPASAGAGVVPAGNARSWGDNYFGQLGDGTSGAGTGKNIPGAVRYLDGAKSIKAGCAHGLALLEGGDHDGLVRAWDDNTYGQLGNGNTGTDSDVSVGVKDLPNVKNIDGGYEFTLATTQ
jgi:alpha-tubulin suppressor-like RCC1 family protein